MASVIVTNNDIAEFANLSITCPNLSIFSKAPTTQKKHVSNYYPSCVSVVTNPEIIFQPNVQNATVVRTSIPRLQWIVSGEQLTSVYIDTDLETVTLTALPTRCVNYDVTLVPSNISTSSPFYLNINAIEQLCTLKLVGLEILVKFDSGLTVIDLNNISYFLQLGNQLSCLGDQDIAYICEHALTYVPSGTSYKSITPSVVLSDATGGTPPTGDVYIVARYGTTNTFVTALNSSQYKWNKLNLTANTWQLQLNGPQAIEIPDATSGEVVELSVYLSVHPLYNTEYIEAVTEGRLP